MTIASRNHGNQPVSAVMEEFRRLIAFFGPTHWIEIESRFDMAVSLEKIMRLNESSKVYVVRKNDSIRICRSHHGARANVLPVFVGKYEASGQKTVLRGQLGVDVGIRFAMGFIAFFIFIFFPNSLALGSAKETTPGGMFISMLVFFLIVGIAYLNSRSDVFIIKQILEETLNPPNTALEPTGIGAGSSVSRSTSPVAGG